MTWGSFSFFFQLAGDPSRTGSWEDHQWHQNNQSTLTYNAVGSYFYVWKKPYNLLKFCHPYDFALPLMQSCKEELFQLVILEKAPYTACSWSRQPGVIWQFLSQKIMKYENGPHLRFKEHLLSTSNKEADILSQTSRWSHESIPDVTCRSPKLCQLMMIWVRNGHLAAGRNHRALELLWCVWLRCPRPSP